MNFWLKKNLGTLLWTTPPWSLAIFVAVYLIADTPFDLDHFAESLIAGFLSALGSNLLEALMERMAPQLQTWQTLLLRTGAFVVMVVALAVLFILGRTVAETGSDSFMPFFAENLRKFFLSKELILTLSLVIPTSFTLNFFTQLQRMLGPGNLWNLILGTYQKPIEENRIFLFIDLSNSTPLAETLGSSRFAELKHDFFFDLTNPVLDTHAEIVDYVGDEAILSWRTQKGIKDANWLRCLLLFDERIRKQAAFYEKKYGASVTFKAAAHEGPVIVSEMGNLKRKIAYSGDCLNATARMEALCGETGCLFLVSDHLLQLGPFPRNCPLEDLGFFSLRGKADPLKLWGLKRNRH